MRSRRVCWIILFLACAFELETATAGGSLRDRFESAVRNRDLSLLVRLHALSPDNLAILWALTARDLDVRPSQRLALLEELSRRTRVTSTQDRLFGTAIVVQGAYLAALLEAGLAARALDAFEDLCPPLQKALLSVTFTPKESLGVPRRLSPEGFRPYSFSPTGKLLFAPGDSTLDGLPFPMEEKFENNCPVTGCASLQLDLAAAHASLGHRDMALGFLDRLPWNGPEQIATHNALERFPADRWLRSPPLVKWVILDGLLAGSPGKPDPIAAIASDCHAYVGHPFESRLWHALAVRVFSGEGQGGIDGLPAPEHDSISFRSGPLTTSTFPSFGLPLDARAAFLNHQFLEVGRTLGEEDRFDDQLHWMRVMALRRKRSGEGHQVPLDDMVPMVAAIFQDTDSDGLNDLAEGSLGLDPDKPDGDGDGLLDGEDPMPNVRLSTEPSPGTGWRIMVLQRLFCCSDRRARIAWEQVLAGSLDEARAEIRAKGFDRSAQSVLIADDPREYAALLPDRRVVLLDRIDDRHRHASLRTRFLIPREKEMSIREVIWNRDRTHGFIRWSWSGEYGGTFELTRAEAGWTIRATCGWLS